MKDQTDKNILLERDYWKKRSDAISHLSSDELEKAIQFGQQNDVDCARFDLTLEEVLRFVYIKQFPDDIKTHIREGKDYNLAKDEVYLFLEDLFRRGDFFTFRCELSGHWYSEYYEKPRVHDSPLYLVATQGDIRMLDFLLKRVDHDAPWNQGLYDAVLQYYLYMKLPDWGSLEAISGSQEELLCAVEKQADFIGVKRFPVLRTLLEAGFPSSYRKLPLEYSEVHIVPKSFPAKNASGDSEDEDDFIVGYYFVEEKKNWTVAPRGNGNDGYAHNDLEMVRALTENGKFYPFTCECGESGCAGLWEPIQCLNTPSGMRWYKPYPLPMSCIAFDPKPALAELEHALTAIEERLRPEWGSELHGDKDWDFPYGPHGTFFSSLEEALALCRERLTEIETTRNNVLI